MSALEDMYTRTRAVIGEDGMEKLKSACVAVFGAGGVGASVIEGLARSGVGKLIVIDGDEVVTSNINRQLIATTDTVGMRKTEAVRLRLMSINPSIRLELYDMFYTAENADDVNFEGVDFVCDAIDTVTSKMEIIRRCKTSGIPLISCLGTGNKIDPTRLEITDIYKTSVCPLAREIRRLCRRDGIESLKVLYSTEEPIKISFSDGKKAPIGSVSFVPSVAGFIIAGEIIKSIAL